MDTDADAPATSLARSATSVLRSIAKTKEARRFLHEEKERIQREYDPCPHFVVATYCDLLEYYPEAESHLLKELESIDRDLIDGAMSCSAYLNAIAQLSEREQDALWLLEKVRLSLKLAEPLGFAPQTETEMVPRVPAEDLSLENFRRQFLLPGRPVVITGLKSRVVPSGRLWDFEYVSKVVGMIQISYYYRRDQQKLFLGDRKIPLKRSDPESAEWAKLELAKEGSVKELLQSEALYLFDWSLPLFCPDLNREFSVPEYFRRDYLKATSEHAMYRNSWPSLFLAPGDRVHSALHVDAFASHFWMFLFQGMKKWTFFRREDLTKLRPVYLDSMDPVFECDVDALGN